MLETNANESFIGIVLRHVQISDENRRLVIRNLNNHDLSLLSEMGGTAGFSFLLETFSPHSPIDCVVVRTNTYKLEQLCYYKQRLGQLVCF